MVCNGCRTGDFAAQTNLGVFYQKGIGVKKDEKEAVKWYRKAAENGNAVARANLGQSYYYGNGVKQIMPRL